MDISFHNLKKQFEENPVGVISTAATGVAALVGLGNMATNMRNSRTWKKEVKRRIDKSKK